MNIKLKNDYLYHIKARNNKVGLWYEDKQAFVISRTKWGYAFLDTEFLYGPDDGTAIPLKEISGPHPFCNDTQKLIFLNNDESQLNWGPHKYVEFIHEYKQSMKENI